MRERGDLSGEVRRSLHRQADGIDIADVPFDPTAPGVLDPGEPDGATTTGRPSPAWRWAAVAAVLVAVATGVVGIGTDDGEADERTSAEDVAPPSSDPIPDGVADAEPGWLPAVPEGLEVWSLDWGTTTEEQPPMAQLFESRTSAARLLVVVRPDGETVREPDLEVRGRPASASQLTEAGATLLEWEEGGADVTAMVRGMARSDAVTLLDGLRWRTDAPAGGFANPTGAPLDLAAEAEGGPVEVRTTTVVLADGPASIGDAEGEAVTVEVGSPVEPDRLTVEAIEDRFEGEVDAAGVIRRYRSGSLRSTDPDGTWIEVAAAGTADEDSLAAIADSVTEADPEELLALRAEVERRVADEIPVEAEIEVDDREGEPDATVELRTVASAGSVCLVLDGRSRRCSGVDAQASGLIGSFLVDDRWWVAGVHRSEISITPESSRPGSREGHDGIWDAVLVAPSDAVDVIEVDVEGETVLVTRPST